MTSATDVAVVGGGITGLAAAWELAGPRGGHRPVRVTVLEAGAHLGGRIDTLDLGGRPVDAGADAFIARVPDAVALCQELGVGEQLVAPAATTALIWSRGELRRLPEDTVLGVPTRLRTLAASISENTCSSSRSLFGMASLSSPSVCDLRRRTSSA